MFAVSEHPTHDPAGLVAGFADATGRFLPLVCTLNATKVLDATARLLGVDLAGFDALAVAAPVGADGVTLLPYFDGERTPDRPSATGVVAGLRSDVTREQLAGAAVEGVVCGLLDGLDALGSHVPTDGQVWVLGGGAHSPAARRALATLLGREVRRSGLDEAVATGACVQAAAVLRGSDPAAVRAEWELGGGDVTEPEGTGRDEVAALRARYRALRDSGAGDPDQLTLSASANRRRCSSSARRSRTARRQPSWARGANRAERGMNRQDSRTQSSMAASSAASIGPHGIAKRSRTIVGSPPMAVSRRIGVTTSRWSGTVHDGSPGKSLTLSCSAMSIERSAAAVISSTSVQ